MVNRHVWGGARVSVGGWGVLQQRTGASLEVIEDFHKASKDRLGDQNENIGSVCRRMTVSHGKKKKKKDQQESLKNS